MNPITNKKDLETTIDDIRNYAYAYLEKYSPSKQQLRIYLFKKLVRKNQKTSSKKEIFNLIDKLIFLKVPSFKFVLKWRLLQEKKLRITSKGNKTMTDKQIKNFVMYYERLTKHMLRTLPKKANTVISIDEKHRLKSIKFN